MFRRKFLSIVLLVGMLTSQAVPRVLAATSCNQAQFISDLTTLDGSSFAPGAAFTKTWRLMNIGTCVWTTVYKLVWVGGDSIGAPVPVKLPVDVAPGQMVDISVNLTAPTTGGHYKSLFKISNASSTQFGIGDSANDPFWVDINVVEVNATIYDFLANAPYAQWKSGAGILPFPGTSGDSRGFAYQVNTTDGEFNWTQYNVPFNNGSIQFLDNNHGFALSTLGAATNKQSFAIYQTSDGGATWVRNYINDPTVPGAGNSLPLGGHKNGMTFRDTTPGWVGGDTPTNGFVYLYKTVNSGVTWTQQSLALPAGYESAFITITAPTFFGTNDAILPVWMTLGADMRDLFLYVTHDGGVTWSRSTGFARNGENTNLASVRDAFSWDGFFHVTNDSGATWRQVTPNVNFGDSVRGMDFISTTTGWMLDTDLKGNLALYRTNDGGSTWTLLFGNAPTPTPTQLLPDLTVTGLRIELQNTSCLMPNDQIGVRLWINNNGQASAGSFVVRVKNVDQIVNGLGIGETTMMFFPGSSNPVTAIVDTTGTIPESDETNNTQSEMVPIPTPPLPCVAPAEFGQNVVNALNAKTSMQQRA